VPVTLEVAVMPSRLPALRRKPNFGPERNRPAPESGL